MTKMLKKLKYVFPMLYLLLYCHGAVAAVLVREDDIASAVKTEFVNNGVEDELDLEFFGGRTSFSIAGASSFKIMITDLKFSEQQDKFSCRAEIYADGKLFAATDLTGKFYRIGEISVPARDIGKGEIIHNEDLKLVKMRRNRIKSANVTDKDKMLNKEAKRMLKEGKLITANDLGEKMLIKKGDVVTALYATPHMQITAKVQALEDGAKGRKIELLNTKSKKNLYGEVIDAETVKIDVQ